MHIETKPKEERMRNFNAEQYVGANSFDLEGMSVDEGIETRCIDGREDRQWNAEGKDRLPPVAIPGSGVGFVMDVMSGVHLLEKRTGRRAGVSPESLARVAESVIGEVSYHTDSHKAGDPLSCAGCGYCALSLATPEEFLLSAEQAAFVQNRFLPELRRRGIEPVLYQGAHEEAAVMVVDGLDIGLPATAEGTHVYVYNRGFHEELLARAAREIFPLLAEDFPGIALPDVREALCEAARKKLSRVAAVLAAGKPQFRVFRNSAKQVLVERMGEVPKSADEDEGEVEAAVSQ